MEQTISPPVIEVSTDLGLFKTLKGNREVRIPHVKKLKEFIQRDPSALRYNPILVNSKMEVIDGQHRLATVGMINEEYTVQLPVYYIIKPDAKLKTAIAINSSAKPWTPNDYAESYANQGNEHYQIYIDFIKQYKLNHDVLLSYLGLNNPVSAQDFKDEDFVANNPKVSKDLCEKLSEVGQFYPEYKKRSFAMALGATHQIFNLNAPKCPELKRNV